jgi:hypothetical protein
MIGKKKRGYTIPSVFLFVKGHMSKVQGTAFPYGGSGGASGALCPFIDDPHPDCYCVDMDSMKMPLHRRSPSGLLLRRHGQHENKPLAALLPGELQAV